MNPMITETEVTHMMWELKETPREFNDDTNIKIADELVSRGLAEKTNEGYRLTKTGEKELMERGGNVPLHRIEDTDKKEISTCKCPTMSYHTKLTEQQRDQLGDKYLAEGSTIKDNKTNLTSDITAVEHNGFRLKPQSAFEDAPRQEFTVPFEEVINKHSNGDISISGYESANHNILILVVKDIMACNIIKGKDSDIQERENEILEKDKIIDDLNDRIENEVEEEVEVGQEMASGGIIGEVKATRNGAITQVRDINGKLLKQVYIENRLYKRTPNSRYHNNESGFLYTKDSDRIHMAYGGIVGVETLPNFYRVDIGSPKNVNTCRTPKWAQHVAESVKSGAKVTVCKKYKKWWLSGVLVPKDGISSSEAEHIGKEIKDKIEHKKMESGGRMLESGASSPKVDNLILFADNSGNLAEMRDAIYTTISSRMAKGASPTREDVKNRFKTFLMKAKGQYIRERGNTKQAKKEVSFTSAEDDDFLNVYAEDAWGKSEGPREIEVDYDKVRAIKYWGELTTKKRLHFLLDHADYVFDKALSQIPKKELDQYKKLSSNNWNHLPKEVTMAIEEHVIAGTYETGGELSGYTSPNGNQNEELIGEDVKSTIDGILVLIDCADTEEEKERLRGQLKEYDYQAN